MNDDALRELYRRTVAARSPRDRARCPPPEALQELVEREGPEDVRLKVLDHVMACGECRRELDLLRAVHAARPTAEAAPPAPRMSSWPRPLLASAAVLVLVIGGVLLGRRSLAERAAPEVLRGEAFTITRVAPAAGATVRAPVRMVWRSVAGATRYTVEVLDAEAAELYTGVTADTAVTIPPQLGLAPGAEYQWWVRAHLGDGGERSSTFGSFRVQAP